MKTFCLLASLTLAISSVRGASQQTILSAGDANHFAGFALSNSATGTTTYTCRTQAQWHTIANDAKTSGFRSIRLTGLDCNALDLASSAAAPLGLTILAGIFYSGTVASSQTSINNDVETFKAAYRKYGGGRYIGLTVGNEANDTPGNIIGAVNQVRANLKAAGISIPVSTVHTWVNVRDNSVFCQGDFVGANAHAFFDGNVVAKQAGSFVFNTVVPALKATCPGKKIMITESGWPSRGPSNRAAVASLPNEHDALVSLNCASRGDTSVSVFAFEYDDQLWKGNDNERSFGMFGKLRFNGDILASC